MDVAHEEACINPFSVESRGLQPHQRLKARPFLWYFKKIKIPQRIANAAPPAVEMEMTATFALIFMAD
jgi:hypothetical protein